MLKEKIYRPKHAHDLLLFFLKSKYKLAPTIGDLLMSGKFNHVKEFIISTALLFLAR